MKNIKVKVPAGTPWIDYSALSLFQRCPRSYYWRMIQHVTPDPEGAALTNGTAYHTAKAVYLQCKMDGADHTEAMATALEAMTPIMLSIKNPDKYRNISVAHRTLTNYFNHWKDSHYVPKAVEIGFAIDLINFFFVGRSDSFEKITFGDVVVETKTTTIVGERWQFRGDPNLQIDGYVAARYITTGEMPFGAVLDVIPIHDSKLLDPFRILAPRTVKDIEIWMEDLQHWWNLIQQCKASGIFPKHTEMCIPLVGFSCNYRLLCKKFKSPHHMEEIKLPGDFKLEPWVPFDFEVVEGEKNESVS